MVKICKNAIAKASNLRKSLPSHRETIENPLLREKNKILKNEQKQSILAKNYIKVLENKVQTMEADDRLADKGNKAKKLNNEVKELENHRNKLLERLYSQWQDISKIDPQNELNSRMMKTAQKVIANKKTAYTTETKLKKLEKKNLSLMEEYSKLVAKKKGLVNK
mgnify:CR=1 FL=1